MIWPWPLTFRGHLRSKIVSLFESPYTTSHLTPIDTFSLSHTIFEIFDFKVFRFWPWPLTLRGHRRSEIFSSFESPYTTSYLTSIDTLSLSRIVFVIFDFKVFRVWLRPLIFRVHQRSKIFSPFESPYMISYLTSIDTFPLSCTVFEIFDFKVFRVWPSPLTFRGHQRSEIFSTFESPYMTFYLTSIDTFLYRAPFSIHLTSKISVFGLDLWPLEVTSGQKYSHYLKAHTWLPIKLVLTLSLYLVLFSRYPTSKFSGFDLDLWPLEVTRGQK